MGVHDPPSPRPNLLRLKKHYSHPTPAVGRLLALSHTAHSHRPTQPPPRLSKVALFDQTCCLWAEYVALALRSSCGTWCCQSTLSSRWVGGFSKIIEVPICGLVFYKTKSVARRAILCLRFNPQYAFPALANEGAFFCENTHTIVQVHFPNLKNLSFCNPVSFWIRSCCRSKERCPDCICHCSLCNSQLGSNRYLLLGSNNCV